MIGPFGDQGSVGGIRAGAGEALNAGDLAYIDANGYVMRAIEDQSGTSAAINDVQTTTIQGTSPTPWTNVIGGTVIFGYQGQYTAPLYPVAITDPIGGNIAATTTAQVQTAIQGLSTVGAGNVLVTGSWSAGLVFTAASAFAGTPLELIEVESALITTDPIIPVVSMVHTTMGQPIGDSAEQATSRVRGMVWIKTQPGQPVTLWHGVIFQYSDGNLTPGEDLFLSGTVPGGLDTTRVFGATIQRPVAFAMDTQRIWVYHVS
jgi:hypothetical protein